MSEGSVRGVPMAEILDLLSKVGFTPDILLELPPETKEIVFHMASAVIAEHRLKEE